MAATLTTALIAALLVFGAEAGRVRRDDAPLIPSDERFNFFDFELLKGVSESVEGNVLVSPASVKSTLAMLLEAAGGKTADELLTALRMPASQNVRKFFKAYLDAFKDRLPGYKLELNNRVFVAKSLNASERYAEALRNYYYADIASADFTRPDRAAQQVNKWVRNVTRGLIPELVTAGTLNAATQALVANAVYFKGLWEVPFPESNTQPRCFYTRPGHCLQTNMMDEVAEFKYGYVSRLDAHAVELPYKGEKFTMLLLLPKSQAGIDQLVHDITHAHMSDILSVMDVTEVLLSLPRFTIDFSADLVNTLRDLNIRELFTPGANLTGMFAGGTTNAMISNIFHKAKIVVNEEGSEAAAATGGLVVPLMGSTMQTFRADHPFLFFIRDATTGAVLFAGRLSEPEQAASANVDSIYTSTRRSVEGKRGRSS